MPTILESAAVDAPVLRPLRDLVYVRQDVIPEKEGQFWLPDNTRLHKAVRYGTVLAVGPGRLVCYEIRPDEPWPTDAILSGRHTKEDGTRWVTRRIPPSVKPGDRIMFNDFSGDCVGMETDPSLLIMKPDEILAVVQN